MLKLRFVVMGVATMVAVLLTVGALSGPASAFGPGYWDHLGDSGTSGGDAINGKVNALNDQPQGALLVGGSFTDAGGDADADRIALWNGSRWSALSTPSSQISNGEVLAIAYSGSAVYAGGTFHDAGGNGNADFLARWDGASWSPACSGAALNGNVSALQIIGSTLYVGGSFQDGAGIGSADYLLACDLVTGTPRSTVVDPGHPFSGSIYALTADANGVLYAGGGFINLENNPAADNVAYLDGNGWHPLGTGGGGPCLCAVNTFVRSLTTIGTDVFVGTDAKDVAGIPQADHIARWNGSAWSALGSNSAGTDGWFPDGTSLYGMTSFRAYYLFVTGEFVNAGGDPRADRVAMFNGSYWQPVGSDGGNDGPLPQTGFALSVFNKVDNLYSQHLIAGGNFTSAGGDPQARSIASFSMPFIVPFPVPTPSYTPPPPPPPTPTPTPTPTPDVAKPTVKAVDLSVATFRAATRGPAFSAARVGTVVKFTLSERASMRFTVQRPAAGRKVAGECVKVRAGNRSRPSCTRWVTVKGSYTTVGKKGVNEKTFRGRMGGKSLKPGAYRLRMQATDSAKNVSAYKTLRFTIVR